MASRYNLTQERKEKLKKEVLDEIGKSSKTTRKTVAISATKITPPKKVNVVAKKPVTIQKNKKVEVKEPEITNVIVSRPIISKSEKKPSKKKIKKIVTKSVSPIIKKIESKSPAASPIPKKSVSRQTTVDRIKERDLFFNPDSFVKPVSIRAAKFKPTMKIGNKKMFIWGSIVCLILGIFLALAINIYGIYRLNWNGPVSQNVVRILPLPAGSVDGRLISLQDYRNDLSIVQSVLSTSDTISVEETDKAKEQLFNRLVSVNIIENQLAKYDKSITNEQINAEMAKVIDQIGSESKAVDDIRSVYGMDVESFKNNVLKPILAMDILNQLITTDETLAVNQEAKKNAEDALKIALQSGADFKTVVLQYSTDTGTLNQAGDLGWFSRGELPSEIESALFSLNDGEIYNQVVKDDYGYHIYRVESKLIDDETGKESIKISQIFITVNTELYIKSLFDQAVIKRFI